MTFRGADDHPLAADADLVQALLALFAEVDPWDLVAMGAPLDEYLPEVQDLLSTGQPITIHHVVDTFGRFAAPTDADVHAPDEKPNELMTVSNADAQRLAEGFNLKGRDHETESLG